MRTTKKLMFYVIFFLIVFIIGTFFNQSLITNFQSSSNYQNSNLFLENPSLQSRESIANQTYYFWNGTFTYPFLPSGPWSGSENYTISSPGKYSVSENNSGTFYQREVNDQNRLITNSNNAWWGNNTHEPFWIFTNVSVGDTVKVSRYDNLFPGDFDMNVTSREIINLWGQPYECWKLVALDGSNTIAYYDVNTGFLINGSFEYIIISPWNVTYSFYLVKTNAKAMPNFKIISPSASIYYESNIPIIVKNYTSVDSVWYRNSTNGGTSWSKNQTLVYNNTHFVNSSALHWTDGNYLLQIFANNSQNITLMKSQSFSVSTTGPNIQLLSPLNTTYFGPAVGILIINYSYVDTLWYRYNNGTGWTSNVSIPFNGTHYSVDNAFWPEGFYHLQIFANDTSGEIAQRDQWFATLEHLPFNLTSNVLTDFGPRIVLDSNDLIHSTWIRNSSTTYEIMYGNNSNTHSNSFQSIFSSTGMLYLLDMEIDSSDIIHLCWMEQSGLNYYVYYTDNSGGSFRPAIQIPGGVGDIYFMASIAVDASGTVHMVLSGMNWILNQTGLYYTDNSVGSFSAPTPLYTDASNLYYYPEIVVDSRGITHLFWASDSTGNLELYYSNNTGAVFTPTPIQLTSNFYDDILPIAELNSSDTIHLVWQAHPSSVWEIMYTTITGNNISSIVNVTKNPIYSDFYPNLAIDEATTPNSVYIAWIGAAQGQLHPLITDNRKGYFDVPRTINDISLNASYIDLAVHPFEGLTYLVWSGYDGNDEEIYFTQDYQPITLYSPSNSSYLSPYIPLQIINSSTHLTRVWCRNRTLSGGWSQNYTLTWDGTYFSNSTTVTWAIGSSVQVQIFSNDTQGIVFSKMEYFGFDSTPPSGYQWTNTTSATIQKTSVIYINGTAWDPSPGSGVSSITILQSNTSNGVADWSTNIGDNTNFVFYNVSPISDNLLGQFYEINISILDGSGNTFLLRCNITVEINSPYGSQEPATNISNAQNGVTIWVNGTAADDGFGVASVTIQWSNHTGWSANVGSLNSWAFYNTSPIGEGLWEIWVNVTDYANNSAIIICQIFVDNVAPTGSQWVNTSTPLIQKAQLIWINGTAIDSAPSAGIRSVTITFSNTSGGISDWSAGLILNNFTSQLDFAFFNVSPLADNQFNGFYEVIITIEDNAGNQFNLTCRVTVEINPPSGNQDPATQAPTRGDVNGRVWVNGTAFDLGFGLKNVSIQWSNHTGWSSNQGDLNNWAFYNTSPMAGGLYEIHINMTDLANNSAILVCYVYVDYVAPTGSQSSTTDLSSPQNGRWNGFIYVNGSASDGSGVGMLDISIAWTNTSASWSTNLGTNESWSFRNTSAIMDGIYEIIVTLTDKLGNAQNISCYIWVDTLTPTGSQDALTQAFQTIDLNGFLWINGTASDGTGSGIASVFIEGSNYTGATWSANKNSPDFWAFTNQSAIADGIWEVYINITDHASNSIVILAYLKVDVTPPTGAQDVSTANPQEPDQNGLIWVNGTATDGTGVGLLLVEVAYTNSSATWSANLGTNESWAF
ncbi:MAG: hypothetical protein ACTSRS_05675, partial [Candidatus Helarchaeota archaeon]